MFRAFFCKYKPNSFDNKILPIFSKVSTQLWVFLSTDLLDLDIIFCSKLLVWCAYVWLIKSKFRQEFLILGICFCSGFRFVMAGQFGRAPHIDGLIG